MNAKANELLAELGAHAHAGTLTREIFDEAYASIEKLVPTDSLEAPEIFEALDALEQSIASTYVAAQLAREADADGLVVPLYLQRFFEDKEVADKSEDTHAHRARTLAAYLRLYASEIEDTTTSAARKKVLCAIIDRAEERAYDRASTALVMLEHVVAAIEREAETRLQLRELKPDRPPRGVAQSEAVIAKLSLSYREEMKRIDPKTFERAVSIFVERHDKKGAPRAGQRSKQDAIEMIARALGFKQDKAKLREEIDRAKRRRSRGE